jgi:hypothetical protein
VTYSRVTFTFICYVCVLHSNKINRYSWKWNFQHKTREECTEITKHYMALQKYKDKTRLPKQLQPVPHEGLSFPYARRTPHNSLKRRTWHITTFLQYHFCVCVCVKILLTFVEHIKYNQPIIILVIYFDLPSHATCITRIYTTITDWTPAKAQISDSQWRS